jgi:ribosomal 50S subunit-associated protein YjgA (DUF615 family)
MNQEMVARTLSQLGSVVQNILNQFPEADRHRFADAICAAIKEKHPIKEAIERAFKESPDILADLKLPTAPQQASSNAHKGA